MSVPTGRAVRSRLCGWSRARTSGRRGWRSYLFERLTVSELASLASVATTRAVQRDEHDWRAGDRADELFVVLRREVADCVLDADGRQVVHTVHGPGMTVGEPGYFSVERDRSVSNVAVTPAILIRLDRRDLDPFMDRHPQIKDRALEGLAGTVRWVGSMRPRSPPGR